MHGRIRSLHLHTILLAASPALAAAASRSVVLDRVVVIIVAVAEVGAGILATERAPSVRERVAVAVAAVYTARNASDIWLTQIFRARIKADAAAFHGYRY